MRNAQRKFDNYALCKFALKIRVRPRVRMVSFRQFTLFSFLSFFFFLFAFVEGYCFHLISTNIFPDVNINFFYIPSFTFNCTFSLEFPSFIHTRRQRTRGNEDARLSVRMEKQSVFREGKGVPLISISNPYSTSLEFCSSSLLFSAASCPSPRAGEDQESKEGPILEESRDSVVP